VYEVGSSKSLSPFKDTGLVGYWTFEEGSGGTVYDKSSYGFNGTWYGTGSHYGTGKVGSYSGKFNTPTVTSDHVLIPTQLASTTHGIAEASLLMWIKLDNEIPANPYNGLIQLTGYANSNGGFYPYTTGLIYSDTFKTDRVQAISYTGYSLTGWHLLAITTTYGTNGWKMYMNGNVIKQMTGEATVATNYQNVTIGLNSSSRRTQGYIDDVRIYNYALSASEIKAIYNATR
ncbi:MAG TPA: hypothetical protein PK367_01465, partial [Candidatus Paceibacterota bacterium]|nr:hypothetical protein [Candidatus Paceibacterota bacterium]